MCARVKEPFKYNNRQEFHTNLTDWIGDVLYDFLPEHGYEVRDEQIYTAYQVADAMCKGKVHLAEAGLGTGKTFAYLLSAIPYARFTGKPVVVACATTALQEQLAGEGGDVRALSELLGLEVDARMAKDPNQYICDVRVNENMDDFGEMSDEITEWLRDTTYGARSEIPTVPDHVWKKMKWEESLGCDICSYRGFCKVVKAREEYRLARDLIIVDHETFFYDLWTREERILNGQLPILPSYSGVIFDEGHKVLLPAAMQAGQQINRGEIEAMIFALEEIQDARESLATITTAMERASKQFFAILDQSVIPGETSERHGVHVNDTLLKAAEVFRKTLDALLLEMQIEQGLYIESLSANEMQAYEGQIESAIWALGQFTRDKGANTIVWVAEKDLSFWVVPRKLGEMLNKHLFEKDMPVIFTSATLSNGGDFDYFIRTMGLKNPSKSTIGSPFDIENQVVVKLPETKDRVETLVSLLKENGGRALVLANSLKEIKEIRRSLKGVEFPFEVLWEDTAERGYLVRQFRENETSVLFGSNFWEGIDVPGDALTLVIIWELPLKEQDPLIEEQRKIAKKQGLDPVTTVDYPEMGLKLKQGCGRLIRTEEDKGVIAILDAVIGKPWEAVVMEALPQGAKIER